MKRRAKILSDDQLQLAVQFISTHPNPLRNRVMLLLSAKAGLRAVEISRLRWGMVLSSARQVSDVLELPDCATKGGYGGRVIPMHRSLRAALAALLDDIGGDASMDQPVIGLTRGSVVGFFCDLYRALGFSGCSSHSGRRTFITRAARQISLVGGSLRDVQMMAGHASLTMTQSYIEGLEEARRKVIELV